MIVTCFHIAGMSENHRDRLYRSVRYWMPLNGLHNCTRREMSGGSVMWVRIFVSPLEFAGGSVSGMHGSV